MEHTSSFCIHLKPRTECPNPVCNPPTMPSEEKLREALIELWLAAYAAGRESMQADIKRLKHELVEKHADAEVVAMLNEREAEINKLRKERDEARALGNWKV